MSLVEKVLAAAATPPPSAEGIAQQAPLPPPDAYSKYPLPFIIGTKEFVEDENCGLVIPLDDDELLSDEADLTDSDDEDAVPAANGAATELPLAAQGGAEGSAPPVFGDGAKDGESEGDGGEGSEEGSEEEEEGSEEGAAEDDDPKKRIAAALMAQLTGQPPPEPGQKKKRKGKKGKKADAAAGADPATAPSGGLFGGGEEGASGAGGASNRGAAAAAANPGLFGAAGATGNNLFGGGDEEDDSGIFGSVKRPAKDVPKESASKDEAKRPEAPEAKPSAPTKAPSLFGAEEEEVDGAGIFGEAKKPEASPDGEEKRAKANKYGGVQVLPMPGGLGDAIASRKAPASSGGGGGLFGDEEEESGSLFAPAAPKPAAKKPEPLSGGGGGLFGDEATCSP